MDTTNIQQMLKEVLDELKALASTETVIGQPMELDGKSIVPVIRVRVGFGGGGGGGKEGEGGDQGLGGGFGAGVTVEPIAFIISQGEDVSVVGVKGGKGNVMEKLIDNLPDLVDKMQKKEE